MSAPKIIVLLFLNFYLFAAIKGLSIPLSFYLGQKHGWIICNGIVVNRPWTTRGVELITVQYANPNGKIDSTTINYTSRYQVLYEVDRSDYKHILFKKLQVGDKIEVYVNKKYNFLVEILLPSKGFALFSSYFASTMIALLYLPVFLFAIYKFYLKKFYTV
jgi:hypothetical protein